jgi:predicted ATPase
LLTRIIGRESVISTLSTQLTQRRLLTIIGPGGIGKTTIAAAVAECARASFPDGVWFVGLASVPRSDLVPNAVGAVFGIPLSGDNPIDGLTAWLRDKQALIILDNCEHVIDATASLAEDLIRSAPRIRILATSREPLRAVGEWRHRLAPLSFPSEAASLDTSTALQFPAIQLFHERASASLDGFVFDEDDIPALVEICRRLDGVPLALELAAAHVGVLGIKGLAARLDDRFALLIQGRRTALPRHQTLRATLDWSYGLLPGIEQVILRRLAAFQGEFTMDAAAAIAADANITPGNVVNGIANLVDKSLIAADIGGEVTYYHLLELTRSYAQERLCDTGEHDHVLSLHAAYFLHVFARAEAGARARSRQEWVADYGRHIGNLRVALDWAFSPDGDASLGVALAAATMDVWIAMSLLNECCDWGMKAVALLGAAAGSRDEMKLQGGLGKALTYSRGMGGDAKAAITRALTLAEALGDSEHQLRSTYTLWLFALRVVDLGQCLALARACGTLAETMQDAAAKAMADFALGQTQYYLGQHIAAAANLARARAIYPIEMRGGDPIRLGADLLTCSSCYQAVTFWSLGRVDQAYQAGRDAISQAHEVNHAVSMCTALAAPSSILLVKMGFLEEAARCIDALIKHAEEHSLTPFYAFGLCCKGGLMAACGDLAEGERLLRLGLQRSREIGYLLFDAFFQGELAAVLASAGRVEEGLVEIDAALRYADQSESLWCTPELLRVKGELLARGAGEDVEAAEEWFMRACALAREQQALSWELRAAIGLARFWRDRGRVTEAREILSEVHRAFTEGFETADVTAAQALLDSMPA